MMKGLLQGYKGLILGLMVLIGSGAGLYACGDFRVPQNHFEGVTALGYVSIWKQIGTLNLGDLQVPVITGFQTYRQQPSAELGSGWFLPLMDANIVQTDEKTFRMAQPDGKNETLKRDKENPNILHGTGGWTAEIIGNDITVHSECGSGWKLVYTNGKLMTLSKGTHTLNIERDAMGRGITIKDGKSTVMTLEQDQATGLAKGIQIGDQKYQLGYEGKPRVENVLGQNMVGGVEQSLHQITLPDGKKETYDFAVTEKMLPNLKITDTEGKERMIVWGLDGRMLQDGDWSYKITPQKDARANAAIERMNLQKQKEYWFKDNINGEESSISVDNVKRKVKYFTSGILAGKLKSSICYNENKVIFSERYLYNETGKIMRSTSLNGEIYYKEGRPTKVIHDGSIIWEVERETGKITKVK